MVPSTPFHAGQHLREEELQPPITACTVCGGCDWHETGVAIQHDPPVTLRGCGACGVATASRFPQPEVLSAYYAGYYDDSERRSDASARVTFDDSARFARHVLAATGLVQRPGGLNLLDLGGGDGTLAVAIANAIGGPVRIRVVDPVPPRQWHEPLITVEFCADLADPAATAAPADLVLASAILEHLPAPGPALDLLLRTLRPGGVLYARTPWAAPLARQLPNFDFCYPGHLHDMGAAFWAGVPARSPVATTLRVSRPSIVETAWSRHPARTAAAWLLKAPAHLEARWRKPTSTSRWWTWVGGWEVVLQRQVDAAPTTETIS